MCTEDFHFLTIFTIFCFNLLEWTQVKQSGHFCRGQRMLPCNYWNKFLRKNYPILKYILLSLTLYLRKISAMFTVNLSIPDIAFLKNHIQNISVVYARNQKKRQFYFQHQFERTCCCDR